jgi:hypothetical protein
MAEREQTIWGARAKIKKLSSGFTTKKGNLLSHTIYKEKG